MNTIGKNVRFAEKGNSQVVSEVGEVIDEVSIFTSYPDGDADKFFIQKIKERNNNIAFRFCYYALNAKHTKIIFGQFAL